MLDSVTGMLKKARLVEEAPSEDLGTVRAHIQQYKSRIQKPPPSPAPPASPVKQEQEAPKSTRLSQELAGIRARLLQHRARAASLTSPLQEEDALSRFEQTKPAAQPEPAPKEEDSRTLRGIPWRAQTGTLGAGEVDYLSKAPALPSSHLSLPPRITHAVEEAAASIKRRLAALQTATTQAPHDPAAASMLMDAVRNLNQAFRYHLLNVLVHEKEKEKRAPVKSRAELEAEMERERLLADISEQVARSLEMPVKEEKPTVPGFGALPKIKVPAKFDDLLGMFVHRPKARVTSDTLTLYLTDSSGNPLPAEHAEFFLDGEPLKPLSVQPERAVIPRPQEHATLYVRLLGYVDALAAYTGNEATVPLQEDVHIIVADEEGKPLDNVFVSLTDEKGNKVEDVHGNFIWRTPFPPSSQAGSLHLALDPRTLSFSALVVWAVRAYYNEVSILVPTNLITSEKVLEQAITLKRLKVPAAQTPSHAG